MNTPTIFEGKTLEEARLAATHALNCPEHEIEFTVVEAGKSGFLGLIGGTKFKVNARKKIDPAQMAKQVLADILSHIGSGYTIETRFTPDEIHLNVLGKHTGVIIGKEGTTLLAIQHLINKILSKNGVSGTRIQIDVQGYRDKRKNTLLTSAKRTAMKVKKTGKPFVMGNMSSYDRYVIHHSFTEDGEIYTKSIGGGADRRIIMIPTKLKTRENEILRRYEKALA